MRHILLAVSTALAVFMTACAGSTVVESTDSVASDLVREAESVVVDASPTAPVLAPATTAVPAATAPPEPPTEPTTEPTAEPTPAAQQLDVDGVRWTHDGTTWVVDVTQFVDLGRGERGASDGQGEGQCVALVGAMMVESVDTGLFASPRAQPQFYLETTERDINYNFDQCDVTPLEAAGYRRVPISGFSQGTVLPFFFQMVIPDTWELEAIRLGNPERGHEAVYLDLDLVDTVDPAPWMFHPGPIEADRLPFGTQVQHDLGNSTWSVELRGVTEVAADADDPGRCYLFHGRYQIDDVRGGGEADDVPRFMVVVDGRMRGGRGFLDCDHGPGKDAGYTWFTNMDFTEGAALDFYVTTFVPTMSDPVAFALQPYENLYYDPNLVLYEADLSAEVVPAGR